MALPLPGAQRQVRVGPRSRRPLPADHAGSVGIRNHQGDRPRGRAGRQPGRCSVSAVRTTGTRWQLQLAVAAGCATFGLVVHLLGAVVPVQVAVIGLGIGVLGASFMLAWAADAGEAVFSAGIVLAVVSLL